MTPTAILLVNGRHLQAMVDPATREVAAPMECPKCGQLAAFHCKQTGKVLALAPRFLPVMAEDFPTIDPTPQHPPATWWMRVVNVGPWADRQRVIEVRCSRCGEKAELTEVYRGVFGPDEDEAVLGPSRRGRVYGEDMT